MLTPAEPDAAPETPPVVALRQPEARSFPDATEKPPISRTLLLSTPACLAATIAVTLTTITLDRLSAPAPIVIVLGVTGAVFFVFTTLAALYRVMTGVASLVRSARARSAEGLGDMIVCLLGNLLMTWFGLLIAYFATFGFSRGRQLRRFGRVLLPGLRYNSDWTTRPLAPAGHEDAPTGVAEQWRENGKTEHASVAAFARLTLDLMALGPPPSLIVAANRDALDEIRHAELCFSLARGLDGKSLGPAPFPEAQRVATLPQSRTLALAKLAVDSLVDGALHEGVSARIIAKLARRCEVPEIRAALEEIAADEGRHAAHGWTVVEWCLDEGKGAVASALLGATRALPKQMPSQLPEAAADGGWERWGIHGRRLESEEYAAALAHLVRRVQTLVSARTREAA